jgi:opacity protein-like surface antigen/outer membrane protease
MQKISVAVFSLLLGTNLASAADLPTIVVAPRALWSWTGLYIGGHVGAGFGTSQFSDAAGPAIYGGNVRSPAALGGGQIGANWQIPNSIWVLGVETDASAVAADGTATCLASSGFFISANCHVRQVASGSLTGRVGVATGAQGRTLIYAKGGLAWLREQIDLTSNGLIPQTSTGFDGMRWGWTVGAGVEKALTPVWSLRLEYDYANFGDISVATPASFLQVLPPSAFGYLPTAGGATSIGQSVQTVKVGLNLKLGEDLHAQWEPPASDYRLRGTSDAAYVADTEIEIGGRTWYSSGRFQKDLGGTINQSQQDLLVSRLTYDTTSATGELFGRIDSSSNLFLKGFIGGGAHLSGKMHDEDWVIFNATVPYSNTSSNPVKGDLGYATIDVGYAVFHGPSSRVGGFVGYNYFRENKAAYGCAQIANPYSDCIPSIPASTLGITENDTWHSFRLGLNGEVKLMDRLTLTADAAYLPFVAFRGTDNHLLRTDVANTVSTETGNGKGVQLEAILAYSFANSFSIGAGGRYWAMWATDAYTNIFGTACPCQTLPSRTERYGGFVQASYKFDGLK